ncbi:MAG: hypothetical protein J7501_07550 [Bdellovibrio sp.]|nr:hypothetical protein [Bdellovibrio sp.]
MKTLFTLICLAFTASSAFAGGVELRTNGSLYPIPGNGYSCKAMNEGATQPDVAAPYIDISEAFITNNTSSTIYPISLTFTTGDYTCKYEGARLASTGLQREIPPGTVGQIFCNIKCGRVPFGQGAKMGYLTFRGQTSSGKQIKVTEEIQVMN